MLPKNLKVTKLLINGEEIYCDNITEIVVPTDAEPWWQFLFEDGRQVWATGNVTVVLEDQRPDALKRKGGE